MKNVQNIYSLIPGLKREISQNSAFKNSKYIILFFFRKDEKTVRYTYELKNKVNNLLVPDNATYCIVAKRKNGMVVSYMQKGED